MPYDDKIKGLRIAIINKSDSTGGAAVVSRRLMEALRREGTDARMLVTEKLTDSPYVEVAAAPSAIKMAFLTERLGIFLRNGLNRKTLFKIDTGDCGLPLWRHPLVKEADAVLLNWVNQGMLSIDGVKKILSLGKPVIWTMHDMWCMTGICHHAGECNAFRRECGDCHLLGSKGGQDDLSHKTWLRKSVLGKGERRPYYVAVSNWLAGKARESSLLREAGLSVIPNAFPLKLSSRGGSAGDRLRIIFGAARLDDPIKGLPMLVAATHALREVYPEVAERAELVTFGNVKDPAALDGMAISLRHLGMVSGEENVRKVYESADILVSASGWETLPGTLVEAQAYGCIPVSFNRGGQADIVDHLSTGYIADYTSDIEEGGRRLAEGIAWAAGIAADSGRLSAMREKMRANVAARFSGDAVARAYLRLIECLRAGAESDSQP